MSETFKIVDVYGDEISTLVRVTDKRIEIDLKAIQDVGEERDDLRARVGELEHVISKVLEHATDTVWIGTIETLQDRVDQWNEQAKADE